MNSSAVNVLNQVPLTNSTQILTQPSQVPMISVVNPTPVVASTPIVASTPVVANAPIVTSTPIVPNTPLVVSTPIVTNQVQGSVVAAPQISGIIVSNNPVPTAAPEDEYRLGRGILDDFRPSRYINQMGMMGVPNVGMTNPTMTPIASNMPVNGQLNIKDFL